jgi:hypothetical protein
MAHAWIPLCWRFLADCQDGTQWQIVSNPNPSPTYNTLYSVTAVSQNDGWAAGFYANSVGSAQTLIEHWNGSGWRIVPNPSPGSFSTQLSGVAAISAREVWTVGYADNTTLIEHDRC